jgi:hypothetical protein
MCEIRGPAFDEKRPRRLGQGLVEARTPPRHIRVLQVVGDAGLPAKQQCLGTGRRDKHAERDLERGHGADAKTLEERGAAGVGARPVESERREDRHEQQDGRALDDRAEDDERDGQQQASPHGGVQVADKCRQRPRRRGGGDSRKGHAHR